MLNIRSINLAIVKNLQIFKGMKNPDYIKRVRGEHPNLASDFAFELQIGHGNILDQIREGKCACLSNQAAGSMRLQFIGFKTFLLKKLNVFLKDTIMYLPKSEEEILKSINHCAPDPYMKFNV
jgi:hypothetical protein